MTTSCAFFSCPINSYTFDCTQVHTINDTIPKDHIAHNVNLTLLSVQVFSKYRIHEISISGNKRHSYKDKAKSYNQTISELDLYVLHKNALCLKDPRSGEVTGRPGRRQKWSQISSKNTNQETRILIDYSMKNAMNEAADRRPTKGTEIVPAALSLSELEDELPPELEEPEVDPEL